MGKEIVIEPVTRLEGHLGVQAEISDDGKVYTDAHSFGTMFRGWEIILKAVNLQMQSGSPKEHVVFVQLLME
jgi:Ni,Fe-hydrogenase I large subunit